MSKSKIEWTDATWNPVTGCSKVSQGCKNCYAEREWPRLTRLVPSYAGRDFTDVRMHADRLDKPLHWKRPRRIFVNSMSDLFHESVSDEFIERVLTTTIHAQQHIFQILTKRPERMRDVMRRWTDMNGRAQKNLWLGVSVEDQATADERIPLLRETPACVRWISAEPLLGPIDLAPAYLPCPNSQGVLMDPETGAYECCRECDYTGIGAEMGIDWVVVGGESGPKSRPMHPQWARDLRDQCVAAGVPFLFKQWGEWLGSMQFPNELLDKTVEFGDSWPNAVWDDEQWVFGYDDYDCNGDDSWMCKVGKKRAGRLLDGVQHDGYPEIEQ